MVDNVRLPTDVERGASGGPSFMTEILDAEGGAEQRRIRWVRRRGEWNIGYGLMNLADPDGALQAVIALFHAQMGRAYAFRFRDWADYQATDEAIGTGDGVETEFQLVRVYSNGVARTFTRTITQPVASTLTVKVAGTPTTAFTLGAGGVITFDAAPADGAAITASFDFDVPVRFDTDTLKVAVNAFNVGSIPSITIKEVVE